MASLRERWTVAWDDQPAVEVTSTALDLMTVIDRVPADQLTNNQARLNTWIVYVTLERLGHTVPPYDEWLLVLDRYEKIGGTNGVEGPTVPAPSVTVPSLSPASPALTGGPGSTRTPRPSRPRKSSSSKPV